MSAGDGADPREDGPVELDYQVLVRRLREEWGMTQEGLAREVGVTYATINGWENGRHKPIPALARVLRSLASSTALKHASVTADADVAARKPRRRSLK